MPFFFTICFLTRFKINMQIEIHFADKSQKAKANFFFIILPQNINNILQSRKSSQAVAKEPT